MVFQKRNSDKGAARKKSPAKKKTADVGMHPADTKVNESTRYKGKVTYFNKSGGFGFIKPDKDGVVPDDKVMVHWKEIQSNDAWPFLHKDLEVEFNLQKFMKVNGSGCFIKAKEVTLPGKKKVNLQDDLDDKREFVHSKATRFTGAVKFYDLQKGFGYVTMEDGYAGVDHVPKELRVLRHQIRSGDEAPVLSQGLKVEFGIVKNLKENWQCYNLTLPGGETVSRNVVEERKDAGNAKFEGTVNFFDFKKGFGYIQPNDVNKLPAAIKKEVEASQEKAKKRLEKRGKDRKAGGLEALIFFRSGDIESRDGNIRRGHKASFKLYTDKRGAGCRNVNVKAA